MTQLRRNMIRDMELKGFSPKTISAYIAHVAHYAKHYSKSPENLGAEEIKDYLHYLIQEKHVSSSYVNGVYSALKFFYGTTLQREWELAKIPRSKKDKKLPVTLSQSEIQQIFNVVQNIKHKAILMTIYAAGLRVSEAANLKVQDIDSKNMQIHVHEGKGKKDRYCILSQVNLEILKSYYKNYYPREWLFPGQTPDKPITSRTIQHIFEKAKDKAKIKKPATVHTLRHSFATHLLEAGVSVYHIQQLMGHANVRTTSIYIHLQRKDVLNVISPLDMLSGVQ